MKTGRYSRLHRERLGDLIESLESDPNPLDILPELALARALLQDFVERYNEWLAALLSWHASFGTEEAKDRKPRAVLDVADAQRLVSEITRIVARIERIRSREAIGRRDLLRIMTEMGRGVDLAVADQPTRSGSGITGRRSDSPERHSSVRTTEGQGYLGAFAGARIFAAFLAGEAQGVAPVATGAAALLAVGVTVLASAVSALRA